MKGGGPQQHPPRANLYGCAATGQVGNRMNKKNLGRKKTLRYSQDLNLGLLNASQILFPTEPTGALSLEHRRDGHRHGSILRLDLLVVYRFHLATILASYEF